jgi:hypothetical protein
MLLYIVSLLVMVIYIRAGHGFSWKPGEVGQLVAGLSLIVLLSILTWRDNQVKWLPAGLLLLLGSAYLWFNIARSPGWRLAAKPLAGRPLEGAGH